MNVFELFATLGLDSSEYESGLDRARGLASSVGGAIGAGLTAVAGMTTAAVGAAATGVVNLTTQAVNSYAEYEQLVGGAELMFGDAYDFIAERAENAYATVQMSQNDYLTQVNGFATGLTTALGGNAQAAAELADRIVNAEADVVAATGNSQEAVQNAFNGIMRSNYTMLDSLQIGIAPTQAGMQEVIDKVNEWHAAQGDLTEYTMDSIADQQAALVDYIEMIGMSGYAQNEASQTIQGSLATLQGAWQNLLTGMGNADADLGALIDNVVNSAMTVVQNITPIAEQAMTGIASLIDQLAPVLEQELPTLIETVLPSLLNAVTSIITAVAEALPDIAGVLLPQLNAIIQRVLPAILSLVPTFIRIGGEIIGAIISGLVDNAGEITQAGLDVIQTLIDSFADAANGDGLQELVDTTLMIVEMIGNFLVENAPTLITAATELITQLVTLISEPSNLQMLIELALSLIMAIADGLVQAAPMIAAVIPQIMANSIQVTIAEFPKVLETIGLLLGDLALLVFDLIGGMMGMSHDEIVGSITAIGDYVSQSFSDFITGLTEWITNVGSNISQMWTDIKDWFTNGITDAMDALGGWWDEISAWFGNLADNALTWASDMINNFVSGITSGVSNIGSAMSNFAETVASYIHFSEPDIGPLANFHTFAPDMIDLFAQGIEDNLPTLGLAMNDMSGYVANNTPSLNSAGAAVNNLQPIVVQAYFGTEKFDEYVINSNQRSDFIAGGRG